MLLLNGRKTILSACLLRVLGAGSWVSGLAGLRSFFMENIACSQRLNSLTATDGAVSILFASTAPD